MTDKKLPVTATVILEFNVNWVALPQEPAGLVRRGRRKPRRTHKNYSVLRGGLLPFVLVLVDHRSSGGRARGGEHQAAERRR